MADAPKSVNCDTDSSVGDGSHSNTDALRFLHDFQQRAYWESTKVLTSFAAVYLAITSAALGYVLVQKLKPPLPRIFAATAFTFSALFFVVFSIWATGLLRQVVLIDKASRSLDADLYTTLDLGDLFRQWRRVNIAVMCAVYIAGGVLVSGILLVLIQPQ